MTGCCACSQLHNSIPPQTSVWVEVGRTKFVLVMLGKVVETPSTVIIDSCPSLISLTFTLCPNALHTVLHVQSLGYFGIWVSKIVSVAMGGSDTTVVVSVGHEKWVGIEMGMERLVSGGRGSGDVAPGKGYIVKINITEVMKLKKRVFCILNI